MQMVGQVKQKCYILDRLVKTPSQIFSQALNTHHGQILSSIFKLATNPICIHQFNCINNCNFILLGILNNIITSLSSNSFNKIETSYKFSHLQGQVSCIFTSCALRNLLPICTNFCLKVIILLL